MLSSNIPFKDRDRLSYLFNAYRRNKILSWGASLWVAVELVSRVPILKRLAYGYRFVALIASAFVCKNAF